MLVLICWFIALPPAAVLLIFTLETLLGTVPLRPRHDRGPMPTTRILIPAHNEAGTIETTLRQLDAIVSDQVRLLVVADNCSDATASLVRQAGHEVIERFDSEHRGKGFALAYGRDHLKAAPPQCVVVFDADCETDAFSIEALAKASVAENRPVQASYIFRPDLSASPKVQISNFALWIKNVVRQRGGHRLGAAAVLVGTGMAFPWKIIAAAPLATSEVVEDLALGLYLTKTGTPPIYLEQAQVRSIAATEGATLDQRTRWEAGFVGIAKRFALGSLLEATQARNRKLFQLGLHLLVPPLALLIMLAAAVAGAVGIGAWWIGQWEPFVLLAISLTLALTAVFINWIVEGHRWLGITALLRLPFYMFWKIPVYLRIVKGGKMAWNRTERAAEHKEGASDPCK